MLCCWVLSLLRPTKAVNAVLLGSSDSMTIDGVQVWGDLLEEGVFDTQVKACNGLALLGVVVVHSLSWVRSWIFNSVVVLGAVARLGRTKTGFSEL